MIQFPENARTDGRTEGQAEGQTEGRTDPIFRTCPTTAGDPIKLLHNLL